MSEPLNGHLELRDRRTGETVGVVVPQEELTALRNQIDSLQGDLARLRREYDLFRQSMQSFLVTQRKPITAEEMTAVKHSDLRGETLWSEIDRLCSEESRTE